MSIKEEQNLFMASISHELRTPLTSILGYGELLEQTKLDAKQQEYLNRMQNSSKYLLSLVGDFLDIVKLENNDMQLDLKEIRLHTLLSECADVIKANIHKQVSFEVDIPFLDYTILGDERRIKQVMLNFLSNAVKFTQEGTIKFHVNEITELEENKVQITVNIEDTGEGMSDEIQKALFDPFVTSNSTQGFGLGLFIAKEIIKLMNGEILVSSKESEGSIFSVSFVVQKIHEKKFFKILSDKKILLFSDEIEYREELEVLLENFGAKLQYYSAVNDISNTLNEVFTKARTYDIVVFDMNSLQYPVADVISTLKMIHPAIKCVALLDTHILACTSSFDRLIYTPLKAQDIVYELEELSALGDKSKRSSIIDFSHLNILIVEDVEMSREYIEEMLLVNFSIMCDTASNGKEGVEKAKVNVYDIIFMDIRMPIMNGYEAVSEIRKFNKNIPIICMSADVYEKDIEAAKSCGMSAFIEKPLDTDKVKQSLLNYIDEKRELNNILSMGIQNNENSSIQKCDPVKLKKQASNYLEKSFNNEVVVKLLNTATLSIEKYLQSIQANVIDEDIEALKEDFHAIRGVLVNLGLTEQSNIAAEIEDIFHRGEFNKTRQLKRKFLKSMTCFVEHLKKDT